MGVTRQTDETIRFGLADRFNQALVVLRVIDPSFPAGEVSNDLQRARENADIGRQAQLSF